MYIAVPGIGRHVGHELGVVDCCVCGFNFGRGVACTACARIQTTLHLTVLYWRMEEDRLGVRFDFGRGVACTARARIQTTLRACRTTACMQEDRPALLRARGNQFEFGVDFAQYMYRTLVRQKVGAVIDVIRRFKNDVIRCEHP